MKGYGSSAPYIFVFVESNSDSRHFRSGSDADGSMVAEESFRCLDATV